jgi:nucleoside-diphosphate-sugar epimerase
VSQRELAAAAGRMIGAGDRTDSFTMDRMFGPDDARVATGISLCLNKRLSSERTRKLLGWSPTRHDILEDLEFGSYASDPTVHTE